jgi:integrase
MDERLPSAFEVADALGKSFVGPAADTEDLLELARRFVELKRALGHRYVAEEERLRRLIRFLHDRGVEKVSQFSLSAFLDWAASRVHVQSLTWCGELSAAYVFFEHLRVTGKLTNNPCLFLRKRGGRNYRPYIFAADELKRIFDPPQADATWKARTLIYYVIYAGAMRVSEAANLKLGRFDRDQGTLFIRKSKFGKDRLLPLHPRVLERLRRHCEEYRSGASPDAPIFVTSAGRPYTDNGLSGQFIYDLKRLGIWRPTCEEDGVRYLSPRTHSLRHTFAVRRLLKWYRESADVMAKLPLLATYMGHSDLMYTQVYLRVTGLLLREAHERFAGRWEKQFPLSP